MAKIITFPGKSVGKPLSTPDSQAIEFPGQSEDGQEIELVGEDDKPLDLEAAGITVDDSDPSKPDNPDDSPISQKFDGNLAEDLDDEALGLIYNEISHEIDEDISGRSKWMDRYEKNLKYLGLEEEKREQPWQGACGVFHPMILEAVTRFNSRGMVKLFPVGGPAKLAVGSKVKLNVQIQTELEMAEKGFNEWLTDSMSELRPEMDRMLFSLADIGYAAKKVYYHNKLGRVITQFVKAESFILPYGCDNLETCPRFTEEVRRTRLEVESLQRSKQFREFELTSGSEDLNQVEAAKAEISGQDPSMVLDDAIRTYESYVDLYIPEDEHKSSDGETSPYIVTIDKDTHKVYRIARNWSEQDAKRLKILAFVPYIYVPGDGSYGYGLIQLVGQLASSATKLLRQLVDAGTLANLPAMLKAKNARMSSQDAVAPGEFRDVEITAEELAKAFLPLPFKEPSNVLFQLMELIVSEGKSFASTADLDISASSQNAPVGTTLALLERQTEVSNAVQLRLYSSFKSELNLIKALMQKYQSSKYEDIFGAVEQLAGPITVCPTGDPTSSTMSQRIIQLQALGTLAQQAPGIYDIPTLHRTIASAMGIADVNTLIPDKTQIPPMNPVEENMAMMVGKPVQPFEWQDHKAHIAVAMVLLTDPQYQQMLQGSPAGQQVTSAVQAHIAQHMAFDFHQQIEQQMGVQLPPLGQQQDPQVDATLSQLMAQACARLQQVHAAEAAQQKAQEMQQDPEFQLQKRELDIKDQERQDRLQLGQSKLALESQSRQDKTSLEMARLSSTDDQAQRNNDVTLAVAAIQADHDQASKAVDIGSRLLDHAEHNSKLESAADIAEKAAQAAKSKQPSSNQ